MTSVIKHIKGDRVIWAVVVALSVFSLLSVYSSSGSMTASWGQVIKHAVILFFSFGVIYLSHLVPYTYYSKIAILALILSIPLLILTIFLGKETHSAIRAIELPGIGLSFQTFDFAKLALIMYVARHLAKNQKNPSDFYKNFLPIIIPTIIICLIIIPQDLSTGLLLFAVVLTLMFIGRVKLLYIFGLIAAGVAIFSIVLLVAKGFPDTLPRLSTWNSRIETFFDSKENNPRESTQENFAKIAIADGKLIGVFPGNSKQRNVLANAPSDFIYAIIVEEYGFVGGVFIILCYLILFFRTIKIALKTEKFFGTLLITGCSLLIVIQAFTNIGYTVGLLPTTGLPLPFISMGGMSLWFTAISIGIILSISKEVDNPTKKEAHATV